jgi:hypothetical protein
VFLAATARHGRILYHGFETAFPSFTDFFKTHDGHIHAAHRTLPKLGWSKEISAFLLHIAKISSLLHAAFAANPDHLTSGKEIVADHQLHVYSESIRAEW